MLLKCKLVVKIIRAKLVVNVENETKMRNKLYVLCNKNEIF